MSQSRWTSLDDPETLRQFVRRLREGIYVTNDRGQILDANPACLQILGLPTLDAARRQDVRDLFVDPAERALEQEALARDGSVRDWELRIRGADGSERTVLDSCHVVTHGETGEQLYQGILVDISARKALERQLLEQSRRDPLTGCYNRRYLAELSQRLAGDPRGVGLIVFDIDHFKLYNDRHGHQAGDEVLVRFSRFLVQNVRLEDALVRWGGDEFLLVLPDHREDEIEQVARRLQSAAERSGTISFTLGWALRGAGESLEEAIGRADRNLISVRVRERGELWPGAPAHRPSH